MSSFTPLSYMSLNNTTILWCHENATMVHFTLFPRYRHEHWGQQHIYILKSSCKITWHFCPILNNGGFSQKTWKKASKIAKISQVEAALMRADSIWWTWRAPFAKTH